MPQYRKKPVVIEARLLLHNENEDEIAEWCNGKRNELGIWIPTLEGDMIALFGDYIIRGVNGEFYPCKPVIFAETYEELNG